MQVNKVVGKEVSIKKKKNQIKTAEYQENFLKVQSLGQVSLSRLQVKEDSAEKPCLAETRCTLHSTEFPLQKAQGCDV